MSIFVRVLRVALALIGAAAPVLAQTPDETKVRTVIADWYRRISLLHDTSSQGIPPNKITNPMPDLRALYYERCGASCGPVADAKKAAEW